MTTHATRGDHRDARPDLVADLEGPLFIGHRGSNLRYPEHSMEGYRAVAAAGFAAEPDVHALTDGTLVCLHDPTVDRTMIGASGRADALTREEWLAARIRPVRGGNEARPVLFEEVLDELGGRTLLVPEIKVYDPAVVTAFIAAIGDRHLQRAVIAQSFDYATAQRLAAAGMPTLLLIGDGRALPNSFEGIKAAGIEYVGPDVHAEDAVFSAAAEAGLRSIVWTVNTRAGAIRELDRGAFGLFSDDVWVASGREAAQ